MKLRYSRRATGDLGSIHEYLDERSPRGAASVMAAIFLAIEFVKRYPEGSETTRIFGVRAKLVPRYRFKMFYRVLAAEDVVEIIHVRHTARRPWEGSDDAPSL